jgi:hypothetical protein
VNEISESVSMEAAVLDKAEFLGERPQMALPSNNSRLSVLIVRLSFAAIIVAPCSKPEALPD